MFGVKVSHRIRHSQLGSESIAVPTNSHPRDLVVGLLARQTDLIDRTTLLAAFDTRPVGGGTIADTLVEQGALSPSQREILTVLAGEHIARHGDTERSLATLGLAAITRDRIAGFDDLGLTRSLALAGVTLSPEATDNYPTRSFVGNTEHFSVGESTSAGLRFRILRPHARGGLGEVYVALDDELKREVALKEIQERHADDPGSRARFVLEAEITGGLEHPGIVPVYGLGSYENGRPFYAMRFIKGESLKEAISAFHGNKSLAGDPGARSLALSKLLRRFLDVCNAIEYAHHRGILHRDLKPANVMVGGYGETLVVDWGLAKAIGGSRGESEERPLIPSSVCGSSATLPGSAIGTPAYMSPEQASGDLGQVGTASDVYSLGATLYSLLTGTVAFQDPNVLKVIEAVKAGKFAAPRSVDPSIDPALEAICLKAMALHAEDRYSSPRALADDVERWTADEPVTAYREPPARRARRWGRRHRTAVTAAAVALLVALVGTATVLAVQTEARRRLQKSNGELAEANVNLSIAKVAAETRFELAKDAIKSFHTGVSEDFLLKEPRFESLRNRLLRSASEFYGRLGSMLKDKTDLSSRRALAQSYHQLAELTASIASVDESITMHRKALELRRAAFAESPNDLAIRAEVADSLIAIGIKHQDSRRPKDALAYFEEGNKLLVAAPLTGQTEGLIRRSLGSSYLEIGNTLSKEIGRSAEALAAFERASDVFEKQAKADPDSPISQNNWATILANKGELLAMMNRPSEAMASLDKAREIQELLLKSIPGSIHFRANLGRTMNTIGIISANIGEPRKAMAAFGESRRIFSELSRDIPAYTEFKTLLADTYLRIGYLQVELGDYREALAAHKDARSIWESLTTANPSSAQYLSSVAQCYNNDGYALSVLGRQDEALASFQKCAEIRESILKIDPNNARNRSGLAGAYLNVGHGLAKKGQEAEAIAVYLRARDIVGELMKLDSNNPQYPSMFAVVLNNIASVHNDRGRFSEARPLLAEAIRIQRLAMGMSPRNPTYRKSLANHLENYSESWLGLRRPVEGAVATRELIELFPRDPRTLYDGACLLARCSGLDERPESAQRLADEAMETLKGAVMAGFRDAKHISIDPDLRSLRDREDLHRLLDELFDRAFPADPFEP